MVIDGVRVRSGAPQVSYGPREGSVYSYKPGPETKGAHQGHRVGDGGHGLPESEPELNRAMVRGSGGYVPSDGRWWWLGWRWLQLQGVCGCRAAMVAGMIRSS
jgi:hypothetical protein